MESLLKPSSVHALAALRLSLGDSLQDALSSAAALALDGCSDPCWEELEQAKIYVFEDSAIGIQSASAATRSLARYGIQAETIPMGITASRHKAQPLEAAGARVFPNLQEALEFIGALA